MPRGSWCEWRRRKGWSVGARGRISRECSRSRRRCGASRDVVIGESAWDIEAIWNRMYRYLYYNGMGGVVMAAISGIDIALYDIVGKKLGVPVYKLLGGKVHDTLRIYANGWTENKPRKPGDLARRTRELVAKGYPGCKFDPFLTSPFNREVTPQELRGAVEQVQEVREAGGPDYEIAIDVHGRWNVNSTFQILRALEPYRLFFYEEALPPENVAAMAEVQRAVKSPGHGRADLRAARLPRAAGTARRADRPAGYRPDGRDHRVQEDRDDGGYVLRLGRPPQPERADLHDRLDPRLLSRSRTSSSSNSSSPTSRSSGRSSTAAFGAKRPSSTRRRGLGWESTSPRNS